MPRLPLIALLSSLLISFSAPLHATLYDDGLTVEVSVDGNEVHIDISALIDAKPSEVWAVFTDFEHMADFVSNLKTSQIIARSGPSRLTVEQRGRAGVGPISFALDSVRDIQLQPFEWIRSRLLSGAMKKFEGITRFFEEGGRTRLSYHSDAISGSWIPPVIGRKLIEDEAHEQFAQMLQEVLRRRQNSGAR